jgi:bromodomain-containing protein 7/9
VHDDLICDDTEFVSEKPGIRLVLKVGDSIMETSSPADSENERRHRHKKKKKRHRHEKEDEEKKEKRRSRRDKDQEASDDSDESEDEDDVPPPTKVVVSYEDLIASTASVATATPAADTATTPAVRSRRERKPTIAEPTPLQQILDHFQKLIEKYAFEIYLYLVMKCVIVCVFPNFRKDPNGFFAFPVTDAIAPMYSRIISHPMDLSTMRSKIDSGEYETLPEYVVSTQDAEILYRRHEDNNLLAFRRISS